MVRREQVSTWSKGQLTEMEVCHLGVGGSDNAHGDVSGFLVDICSAWAARNLHVI